MNEFDVAIIGGGPAGSAAALTLLRYSKLRPVIFERSSYVLARRRDALSRRVPLLQYLARSPFSRRADSAGRTRPVPPGEARNVVSRDFLFTGGGDAWHLDRAHFRCLARASGRGAGGTLLMGTPLTAEALESIATEIRHRRQRPACRIRAHARRTRHRRGHAHGLVPSSKAVRTRDRDAGRAVEDGWWYSAAPSRNRLVWRS